MLCHQSKTRQHTFVFVDVNGHGEEQPTDSCRGAASSLSQEQK